MHSKFLDWFQAKLCGKSGRVRQAQDGLKPPAPPCTWDTAITPVCTDFIAPKPAATVESAFFQHLPPEIRHKILVMAFGDRTMHMSLEFNHPRQHVSNASMDIPQKRKYMPPTALLPPEKLQLDKKAPVAWQWRGCPCWRVGRIRRRRYYNDDCLPGVARCWEKASDVPDMCLIGAMGWLLTCRQAYLDGTEVLYSTNTFHLSNRDQSVVIHHLQALLSPRYLAMITSIELDWCLVDLMELAEDIIWDPTRHQDTGRLGFLAILEAIPKALPSLRAVYMDVHGPLFFGLELADRPPFYDQYLFKPIDDMVRTLGPQLQEFILAVPFTISQKLISRAFLEGWKSKGTEYETAIWRPLSALGVNDEAERVREEEAVLWGSKEQGYWITQGAFDDPYPRIGCGGGGQTMADIELRNTINNELNSWTDKDKPSPRPA